MTNPEHDETGPLEHGQVVCEGRQRHRQRTGQRRDARRTASELLHDRPPRRIGKCVQHRIDVRELVKHPLNYQPPVPGSQVRTHPAATLGQC